MKTCRYCRVSKELTEFYKNGPKYYNPLCKACTIKRNGGHAKMRKEAAVPIPNRYVLFGDNNT